MERSVVIKLCLEGEEETHQIEGVPLNYDELAGQVYRTTGAAHFKIKFRGHILSTTRDLLISYLENKSLELIYEIDDDIQQWSFMGTAIDKYMTPTDNSPKAKLTVTNGTVDKLDLLQVIHEMAEEAKTRLVASNKDFMLRRQEVYGVDEEKWRQIAFEQLGFQEKLLMAITGEATRKFSINPEIFHNSCRTHCSDPRIAQALEEMATKTLEAGVELPESLTKEKLREVLNYTCDYLENFLRNNPPSNPADFILLKVREGDEVMKQFGFDENQVATSLSKYGIDQNEEWADIRERLGNIMKNGLGFDPGMMGMGF